MIDRLRVRLKDRAPVRIEEPGTIEASVSVVLAAHAAGPELLFIRRAEHPEDPWSGHIALPGGRREPGEDRLATARRETLEETSLDLSAAELIGELDDLHPRTPVLPPVVIRPFVFTVPARAATSCSVEVSECLWLGVSELAASAGTARVLIRGELREVEAFVVGGRVIWGLTHRILAQLLELGGEG